MAHLLEKEENKGGKINITFSSSETVSEAALYNHKFSGPRLDRVQFRQDCMATEKYEAEI